MDNTSFENQLRLPVSNSSDQIVWTSSEENSKSVLAADAYLTFIAIIHQVWTFTCGAHKHTCTDLPSITVFQQTIGAL